MLKERKSKLKNKRFSLMEIMVVLIIIGLVLGMVGPSVIDMLVGGQRRVAKSQILALSSSVKTYYLDLNRYPESLEDLARNPERTKRWGGPYVENGVVPKDPWGNHYLYVKPSSRYAMDFEILSYGPDGAAGGEGSDADIGNWPEEETD